MEQPTARISTGPLVEKDGGAFSQAWLAERKNSFERLLDRFADSLEHHWLLWLLGFSLLYALGAYQDAHFKPFWFDELCTYYTSLLPDWKTILEAGKADSHPPLQNYLVKLGLLFPGPLEIRVRLPFMLAYWTMSVCLFQFVRKRAGAVYGFVALLLPMLTDTHYYATEARPYALACGFAGLSLLFWRTAVDSARRILPLVLLALSLAGGVSSHYYGLVQVAFPIVLAELVRSFQRKRVDTGLCIAVALGLSPLLILVPLGMRASQGFSKYVLHFPNFWHHPQFNDFDKFYGVLLHTLVLPMVAVACYALFSWRARAGETDGSAREAFSLSEKTAVGAFLLVPLVLLLFTKLRTGYFMDRYAETAICGVTLLVGGVLYRYCRRNVAAFTVIVFLCLIAAHTKTALGYGSRKPEVKMPVMPDAPGSLLVVTDALRYLQIYYYASPEMKSRLYFVADLSMAVQMPDLLPELSLIAERWYVPARIVDYAQFIREHPTFHFEYNSKTTIEWLPKKLVQDGYRVTMDPAHCCTLYEASRNGQ